MHVMACECCYSMKKSIITFNWNMFEWSKQSPRTYKQARALEYSNTQVHNSKVLRLHTSLFIKWLWSCTFDFRFLYFGDIFSWNLLIFFLLPSLGDHICFGWRTQLSYLLESPRIEYIKCGLSVSNSNWSQIYTRQIIMQLKLTILEWKCS